MKRVKFQCVTIEEIELEITDDALLDDPICLANDQVNWGFIDSQVTILEIKECK